MSSRRLLALLEALPPESAYWRARRDGDWSSDEYARWMTVNELRLLRADHAAVHEMKLDVTLARSPAQLREDAELQQRREEARRNILAQLYRGSDG